MRQTIAAFTFLLFWISSIGQIVVLPNNNGNQLAQVLAGNGVTISNININCPGTSAGTFSCNTCNLGMQSGIALTSGSVNIVPGPNNSPSAGVDNFAAGNPLLTNLVGGFFPSTYDACILEFDMQVLSDSVEFRYSFGSEEYLEWVNAGFNDVFAFFISGPGIAGQQNIALVPGTATPVAIDNVNDLVNSTYYVDNGDGSVAPQNANPFYIQYDGFTTVLTAKKNNLQPCQTYHLILAIADAGDGIYDSGVFLEANSLTSNGVTVDDAITTDPNSTNAMEGCVSGTVVFRLNAPVSTPVTFTYQISGTAGNGVDYQNIPNTLTIPAGDTSITLNIIPNTDNLTEGTESVVLTLLNPCNNLPYDSAVMQIFDPFPIRTINDTTICAGDQITLTSQGLGVYSWTPASSLSSASALSPVASPTTTTTYIVAANIGTCISRDTVTVNVISAPFSVNAGNDVSVCLGTATTLNAVVTGSTVNGQPFQYLWSPATGLSSTNTASTVASVSAATSYVIQVSSGNCRDTDTVSVVPGQLNISSSSSNQTCFGTNNGSASVNSAAGTNPITYNWSNSSASPSISSLAPGTYFVTVSDANNCSVIDTFAIAAALPIYFTAPSLTNVTCFGGNNGSISISAVGGAGGFSYLWSNSSLSPSINSLSANIYTITATDINSCTADTSIVISQPTALNTSVSTSNITCFGAANGSIDLSVSGAVSPYTYLWSDGPTTQDRTNLGPGNYSVTVYDDVNCSAMLTLIISQPTALSSTMTVTNILCNSATTGAVDLSVNGGTFPYSYLWSNGALTEDLSLMAAGTFTASITDGNNCVVLDTAVITEPALLTLVLSKNDLSCFNVNIGSVSSTVGGGTLAYSYLWNNGATTPNLTNLAAGNYSLTVTDGNQCQISASATVSTPSEFLVSGQATDISCFGSDDGKVNMSVSGGTTPYTFNWSIGAGAVNLTNSGPGSYSVTVEDGNNCSVSLSFNISEPPLLTASVTATNIDCNGNSNGALDLSVNGGKLPYSFAWSNGAISEDQQQLPVGSYTVVVTDSNFCTVNAGASISEPTVLALSLSKTDLNCFGDLSGAITSTTSGGTIGYNYFWSNGAVTPNLTGMAAGNYSLTVSDGNACQTSASAVLNEPPTLALSISSTNVLCYGENSGSSSVSATGGTPGYSYLWSNGVNTALNNSVVAGIYTVTVSDTHLCSASASATITQPAFLSAVLSSTPPLCVGGTEGTITTILVGGTATYQYELLNSGNIISSNSDGAFNGLGPGTYTVNVVDFNGCITTSTVNIIAPYPDVFSFSSTPTSCNGSEYVDGTLTVTPISTINQPYTFRIDNTSNQNTGYFANLSAGVHQITIFNKNGCVTDTSYFIAEPALGVAQIYHGDTVVTLGDALVLESYLSNFSDTSIRSYFWRPSLGLSCTDCANPVFNGYASGDYELVIVYHNGCIAIATTSITVEGYPPVFVPNAFSPNGDGNNDVFMIYGESIKNISLILFDRWGEKVFESSSQFEGWDGTFSGKSLPPAVYVYYAEITYLDNKKIARKGSVTLLN